jgi:hypothetical protein
MMKARRKDRLFLSGLAFGLAASIVVTATMIGSAGAVQNEGAVVTPPRKPVPILTISEILIPPSPAVHKT